MDSPISIPSELFSTGELLLFAGYLLGMLVWIYVSYKHKPGKELLKKLPPAVRWTLSIPFVEKWRDHLDAPDQAEMEKYLIFSNCFLIYFSWAPLVLAYLCFSALSRHL